MRLLNTLTLWGCTGLVLHSSAVSSQAQTPPTRAATIELEWKAAPRPMELPIASSDAPTPKAELVRPSRADLQISTNDVPVLPKPGTVQPVAPNEPRKMPVVDPNIIRRSTDSGVSYRPAALTVPQVRDQKSPDLLWGSTEYLRWWTKGNTMPPLVTTAPIGQFGTLDNPQTRTVFGGPQTLSDAMNGLRLRGGIWLDECATCGLDVGLFRFGQASQTFGLGSAGDPGIFRPFFNTSAGAPDAEVVALRLPNSTGGFDPILTGAVTIQNSTDFAGWEANFRKRLCFDPCSCSYLDFLVGYRYLRLRDMTSIQESLTSTDPLEVSAPLGARINVFDRFETVNTFNGGQVGLTGEKRWGRWSAGFRGTVALGNTQQKVSIDGSTQVITADGASATSRGGLLALPSNIGTYTANRFSVIPELQVNLGYQITQNIRVFGGYSFLYWANVARSGNQIDLNVNPTLLPNNGPATGPNRPAFQLHDTSFWAHGFNIGAEIRW